MPINDLLTGTATGQGSSLADLITPATQDPQLPIPTPRRSRTVMEELGLDPERDLQPLGQVEAPTPEAQAMQDRVSGRRNVRVLDDILGQGTPQVQERRRERLGIADTIDLNSIPGIEQGGTKKTAQAIQNRLRNLPSYAQRVTGMEETVLASASYSDRLVQASQKPEKLSLLGVQIPEKLAGQSGLTFAQHIGFISDVLDNALPGFDPFTERGREKGVRGAKSIVGAGVETSIGFVRGLEAITGKKIIADNADILKIRDQLRVENPTIADKIMSGFGSTIPFYLAGGAVGSALSKIATLGKAGSVVARVGGVGAMSLAEAIAESGGTYETIKENGGTEREARILANQTMGINLLVLLASNAIPFGGKETRMLKRAFATAPMEGKQEAIQQYVGNSALVKAGVLREDQIMNGVWESGGLGIIVGGIMGGMTKPFDSNLPNEIQNKLERAANGEDVSFTDPEYLQIMLMRSKRDGVIGETRLTHMMKPNNGSYSPERESREILATGPSEEQRKQKQDARKFAEDLLAQHNEVEKQVAEGEATDPSVKNAKILANQVIDLLSDNKTRALVQRLTKAKGYSNINEVSPESIFSIVRQAREEATDTSTRDKLNSFLAAKDPSTQGVDSDVYAKEFGSAREQKKSGRIPLSERKRYTDQELADFLKSKPSGLKETDSIEGRTVQEMIDTLVGAQENVQKITPLRNKAETKQEVTERIESLISAKEATPAVSQFTPDIVDQLTSQDYAAMQRYENALPNDIQERIQKNKPLNRTQLLEKRKTIKEHLPEGEARNKLLAQVNEELKKGESPTVAAKRTAKEQQKRAERAEAQTKALQKEQMKEKRRKIVSTIREELRTGRVKKQSGKPVGKFTAPIQKAINILNVAASSKTSDNFNRIAENMAKINKDTGLLSDALILENKLISLVNGLNRKSASELQKVLDTIQEIKETGQIARFIQDTVRERKFEENKQRGIQALTGGKELPKGMKTTGVEEISPKTFTEKVNTFLTKNRKRMPAWDNIMTTLSIREGSAAKGRAFLETLGDVHDVSNAEAKMNREFADKAKEMYADAYGEMSDNQMDHNMNMDMKEFSLGEFTNSDGVTVDMKFNKAELRKRWMEMQDPSLRETFTDGMAYTSEIENAIDNAMTPKDKKFALSQLQYYRDIYKKINEIYRRMYGTDLPFNEFYTPIRREGYDVGSSQNFGEFLQEMQMRMSSAPSSLKDRVGSILPLQKMSDVMTIQRHAAEMNHFITWAEKVQELRAFFDNKEVRTVIESLYGKNKMPFIQNFLDDFTRKGVDVSNRVEWIDKLRGRIYRGTLAGRLIISVKQVTSSPTFVDNMPVKEFIQYGAEFWLNPIENTRMLYKDSETLKGRGQTMERDMEQMMKTDAYKNFRKYQRPQDLLMLNVQAGDQLAIILGGWPYYRYLTKDLGMTHKEAIREFEKQFESTQQSGNVQHLNYWQRNGSLSKMFTMFLSTPTQHHNKQMDAIQNMLAGRITVIEGAKTLAIFQILIPTLFQLASNLGRWDTKDQALAAIIGPWNSIFIAGQYLDFIIRKLAGEHAYDPGSPVLSLFNGYVKAISNLTEKDIDANDIEDAILGFMDSSGKLSGLPLQQVTNIGFGIRDAAMGDYAKGAMRSLLGVTKAQAERRLEEREEETTTQRQAPQQRKAGGRKAPKQRQAPQRR